MDRPRRHSDQQSTSAHPTPVLKVVGFHVEGVAASPAEGIMMEPHHPSGLNSLVGSPNPVIIPPAFQMDSPHVRTPTSRQGSGPETADIGSLKVSQDDMFLEKTSEFDSNADRPHRTTSLPPLRDDQVASLRNVAEKLKEANTVPEQVSGGPSISGWRDGALPQSISATSSPSMSLSPRPAFFPGIRGQSANVHPPALKPRVDEAATRPQQPGGSEASKGLSHEITSEESAEPLSIQDGEAKKPDRGKEDGSTAPATDGGTQMEGKGRVKALKGDRGPPPEKKPPLTRAERRAKQEAEKAAKAVAREADGRAPPQPTSRAGSTSVPLSRQGSAVDLPSQAAKALGTAKTDSKVVSKCGSAKASRSVGMKSTELFAHLPQYRASTLEKVLDESEVAFRVHPLVLQLGLKYADGSIKGGNARCIALLTAFQHVIEDYATPDGKVLSRDLTGQLNTAIQFLVECRPLSVSMGNAIKFLKMQVSKVDPTMPQDEAKAMLVQKLDTFIQEKIIFARDVLVALAATKVEDGDTVLTYGFSTTVYGLLLRAHKDKKRFSVLVVDARPHLEGRALLDMLLHHGISCTYMLLNAVSFKMPEVTKVFLGAAAVMSNGTVMSRVGSAGVAMMANTWEKPVIICCETYKFHERVLLDSITSNELGNPEAVANVEARADITALKNWEEQSNLGLLNFTYDAMPAEYVTVIVTECGAIPPTSVPVILREYRQEPVL
eukprot:jgi/Botrbrau1/5674/Bobra.0071s0015.2